MHILSRKDGSSYDQLYHDIPNPGIRTVSSIYGPKDWPQKCDSNRLGATHKNIHFFFQWSNRKARGEPPGPDTIRQNGRTKKQTI